MDSFWSMCPEASIKVISEHHDLRTCVFSHWKGLASLKLVASLDAYQITNYQFPLKTLYFLLLDFWRIREKVSKSGILWPIAWVSVIKRFIWLFKIMPLGAPRSLMQMDSKWKRVFIEMDLLPTVIINSFKIQNQTFEKNFIFCTDFMIMRFIPF